MSETTWDNTYEKMRKLISNEKVTWTPKCAFGIDTICITQNDPDGNIIRQEHIKVTAKDSYALAKMVELERRIFDRINDNNSDTSDLFYCPTGTKYVQKIFDILSEEMYEMATEMEVRCNELCSQEDEE